jgi:hypothetical protein
LKVGLHPETWFPELGVNSQLDDPLDAIAVHAWNGTWGVIAVGFFAGKGLIAASYGTNPYSPDANNPEFRQWGCFLGGDGSLLGAQVIYALWLAGAPLDTLSCLPRKIDTAALAALDWKTPAAAMQTFRQFNPSKVAYQLPRSGISSFYLGLPAVCW